MKGNYMLTKSELIEQLQTGVYEVTFTKVNGDNRVMPCTLMADHLPEFGTKLKESDTVDLDLDRISVWCTDANVWRAFKPSKLISFERMV